MPHSGDDGRGIGGEDRSGLEDHETGLLKVEFDEEDLILSEKPVNLSKEKSRAGPIPARRRSPLAAAVLTRSSGDSRTKPEPKRRG